LTAENSLDTATTILKSKQCSLCLVVVADSLVEDLADGFSQAYPKGTNLSEGATAFLLASEEGLKHLNQKPLGQLTKVQFDDDKNLPHKPFAIKDFISYYDSNALDLLRADILSPRPEYTLNLQKPDGSQSLIQWTPRA